MTLKIRLQSWQIIWDKLWYSREIGHYGKRSIFIFWQFFASIENNWFWEEGWALAYNSKVLIFPKVISRSASREHLVYTIFITNNQASFHLWWKNQRVSKYYDYECNLTFSYNTLYVVKWDTLISKSTISEWIKI